MEEKAAAGTPTIRDVARKANVSNATVSRVMNNPSMVKEDTKRRVREAMEELVFTPNIIASGMRKGISKTVGIIIPDYANVFYSYMFKEIESVLSKFGYMAIICPISNSAKKERESCESLLSRNIDGIIFFYYNTTEENAAYLIDLSRKIPLVMMDEPNITLPLSQVFTDGFHAMYIATEHLIKNGHTKISCLVSDAQVTVKRLNGYLKALEDYHIDVREKYILRTEFNVPSSAQAASRFLKLKDRPTAVVSEGDYTSIGFINALLWQGIKIPSELELISFDNIDLAYTMKPNLSTVGQPMKEMAMEAVDMLIEKIEDKSKWGLVTKSVFHGQLILRETTQQ